MKKIIKTITGESFGKYGYIIAHNHSGSEDNQTVLNEYTSTGWKMATLGIADKEFRSISLHPNSVESFEPLTGIALLLVSTSDNCDDYEIFLLDKPICLYRNIWHGVCALSEYAVVKLVENIDVVVEKKELPKAVKIVAMD